MNAPELFLCAYAVHIVIAATLFHATHRSVELSDFERLVIGLLWPAIVPIWLVLWSMRRTVRLPRAKVVRR